MLVFHEYDREAARNYARKWALGRNPAYKDYELWGGDCTNFISQCLKSGNIPMDYNGKNVLEKWYWNSDSSRTPTWTAAQPFYRYIIGNNSKDTKNFGIYARLAQSNELEIGDIVQLIYDNNAYHNMIITEVVLDGEYLIDYLICQHTHDLLDYPLSMKVGERRYIKILGYYK